VTLWCNKNNLPESFVNHLRDAGFATNDALGALQTQDIQSLCLPNAAMNAQLRRTLLNLTAKHDQNSKSYTYIFFPYIFFLYLIYFCTLLTLFKTKINKVEYNKYNSKHTQQTNFH